MIEISAPAGSPESLTAAINTGADAVYLGLQDFSARRNAKNFTAEQLYEAAKVCRLSGIKLYLTLNTLIFDDEIEQVKQILQTAVKVGVNAVIIQDLALIELLKEAGIPFHASTQMTITSVSGAKALKKLGFSRVVLARELNFSEIREITQSVDIETEVFIHGALCVCVSGQCYMSVFTGGGERSANRGLCAQPCRLNFRTDIEKEYALSLKDLSVISRIKELEEAGVASVKIEGRMKRPEYVAAAVSACEKARRGIPPDTKKLESVFSRSGFTDGYFTGERKSMNGFRSRKDVLSAEHVLKELRSLYKEPFKRRKINIIFRAKAEKIIINAECDGVSAAFIFSEPEKARNRETTAEDCKTQLSKLGGTIFEAGEISCDIETGLFLPAARLNEIRRKIINEISEKLIIVN